MGAATGAVPRGTRDLSKWIFFAVVAAAFAIAVWADEGFLIHTKDPEWAHIAPFKWLLLVHGLAGLTAFLIGPFQFSDRLRREHVVLHRWMGRIFVGAVTIAASFACYIGTQFEQPLVAAMQPAQAGLWLLATGMALVCVLRGNLQAHKSWMMKSYGFCLIFIMSRVPDAIAVKWTDARLSTFLWYLVALALIGPDIILTARDLWRKRKRA
jgi:uncharacterized membrane protein